MHRPATRRERGAAGWRRRDAADNRPDHPDAGRSAARAEWPPTAGRDCGGPGCNGTRRGRYRPPRAGLRHDHAPDWRSDCSWGFRALPERAANRNAAPQEQRVPEEAYLWGAAALGDPGAEGGRRSHGGRQRARHYRIRRRGPIAIAGRWRTAPAAGGAAVTGGRATTGPAGGFAAIAGGCGGGAVTIGGACRGCGTTIRRGGAGGSGFFGAAGAAAAGARGGAGCGLLRSSLGLCDCRRRCSLRTRRRAALPLPCAAGSPSERRRASTPATSRSSGRCRSLPWRAEPPLRLLPRWKCARTRCASSASSELECVFGSVTPTSLQHIQNGFALDFELSC